MGSKVVFGRNLAFTHFTRLLRGPFSPFFAVLDPFLADFSGVLQAGEHEMSPRGLLVGVDGIMPPFGGSAMVDRVGGRGGGERFDGGSKIWS